jgi:twitching motility protein PilT
VQALREHLREMARREASDLFLRAGSPPAYRVHGRIVRGAATEGPSVPDAQQMARFLGEILPPLARERFAESPDIDVAYTVEGLGRFRINAFVQLGAPALAARRIPPGEVDFDTLHLPDSIRRMAERTSGLVLVVGPTGCGKSTTLAALLHHINATREVHIVTIEDPVEFLHAEKKALVHQRQVGLDTRSFADALRHVVRQSPDVILIGEMRDAETIQTAMSAALTGHLVFSTLHTSNVVQSIERILNHFPSGARQQVRADLAATLVGVVSMRLLIRRDGSGRVPAVEVLLASPLARKLIASGDLAGLEEVMKRGGPAGMRTFNQSLVELTSAGRVDPALAERYAPNPDEFRLNLQGMSTGIDSIDLRNEIGREADGAGPEDEIVLDEPDEDEPDEPDPRKTRP